MTFEQFESVAATTVGALLPAAHVRSETHDGAWWVIVFPDANPKEPTARRFCLAMEPAESIAQESLAEQLSLAVMRSAKKLGYC